MNDDRRRSSLAALGVFVLALIVLAVAQTGSLEVEMTHDSAHYLELARAILRGDGFETQTRWALNIPASGVPRPDTYRAPLYPLLIAGLSPLASDLFVAAKWVSVLTGACIPLMVFLICHRRLRLSLAISLVAAAITIAHHHLVISGTRALTETSYAAATTCALYFIVGSRPRPLLAGLLTGVSWLLRYQALLLFPCALLAFVGTGGSRRAWITRLAVFCAGFLAVSGPWMIRNVQIAGSPIYTDLRYHMVSSYDEDLTTYQYFHGLTPAMEPLDYLRLHPDHTVDHLTRSVIKIGRTFPQENAGNVGFAIAAALGGVLWIRQRRDQWRIFTPFAVFGLANVFLVAIAFVDDRHLTSLDPIIVVLVAYLLAALWRRSNATWWRAAVAALLLLGVAWEVRVAYSALHATTPTHHRHATASRNVLLAGMGPDDAVMGEKPYHLSWVLDRKAVSLPWCSDEEFLEVARRFGVRYACVGTVVNEQFGDPYPGSFLDTGTIPAWLRPVLEIDDPPLVVYEILEPTVMAASATARVGPSD